MSRDARALLWSLFVLSALGLGAGMAGVAIPVLMQSAETGPRLWLDPDPVVGGLLALSAVILAAWPSAVWLGRREPGEDGFSATWTSRGTRQRVRLAALHALVAPAAYLIWMTAGIGMPVELTPFDRDNVAFVERPLDLTCGELAPERTAWASEAMCRWSASRVAPGNLLAGFGVVLAFGVFLRRVRSTDVHALRTDATGFTLVDEAGEQRVGWQDVLSAEVRPGALRIELRDGDQVVWAGSPEACAALLAVVSEGIARTTADAPSRSRAREVQQLLR